MYVYRGRVNAGGQEKGVDVSLALDLVRATYDRQFEVAIIVSQDWDFGPAVRLAKEIAQAQGRRLVSLGRGKPLVSQFKNGRTLGMEQKATASGH